MSRLFSNLVLGASAMAMISLAGKPVRAAVVISYDAAAEHTSGGSKTPGEATPPWTLIGNASNWYNMGSYLIHNVPEDQLSSYTSPKASGTMKLGASNYTVEFRVQPNTDVTAGVDWYARDLIVWADDVNFYSLCIDKDSDDADPGTTGGIRYGSGSFAANLSNAITGIDWSTPHTIAVSYTGSSNNFSFYLDGVFQSSVAVAGFGSANTTVAWQDALTIGATTTVGGVVNNNWYSLSVSNTAVPEPSLAVFSILGFFAMRRRSHRS